MNEVTRILSAIEQDDPKATEQLFVLVYDELRRLAARKLAHEAPGQTLQATALVHEAYIRLVDDEMPQHWNSLGHFLGAAAEAMRRILIERARTKGRIKRGSHWQRVDLDNFDLVSSATPDQIVTLNEALEGLAVEDPAAANLVKLRYFAGLSLEHAAEALEISTATAYRHWSYARARLLSDLLDEGV